MKKNITIIDYGSGNILSAKQSFARVIKKENIDADVCISGNPETIKNSTHIVLPGQGAFETCINGLEGIPGMIEELNNFVVVQKKPFFGICVGMQLLANNSLENGTIRVGLDRWNYRKTSLEKVLKCPIWVGIQ
jgi:glutamine amidotransferase